MDVDDLQSISRSIIKPRVPFNDQTFVGIQGLRRIPVHSRDHGNGSGETALRKLGFPAGGRLMAYLPLLVTLAAAIALAQPSPPADGIQIGGFGPFGGWDIRFPSTVTQCEPVIIFYDTTRSRPDPTANIGLYSLSGVRLLSIGPLRGISYIEWICNFPAGSTLVALASSNGTPYRFTVQPGNSSCLRDVTLTYEYGTYATSAFTSYTANPVATSTSPFSPFATSHVSFPSGPPVTITVNPEFAITSRTSLPLTSTLSASSVLSVPSMLPASTPIPPTRKSDIPAIVGGVIGGVVLALLFCGVVVFLHKRRQSRLEAIEKPIATSPFLSRESNLESGEMRSPSSPVVSKFTSQPTKHTYQPSPLQSHEIHDNAPSDQNTSQREVSGIASEGAASDMVTALNVFSRLPAEQQRALLPVLGTITAHPQLSDTVTGDVDDLSTRPPSYYN